MQAGISFERTSKHERYSIEVVSISARANREKVLHWTSCRHREPSDSVCNQFPLQQDAALDHESA